MPVDQRIRELARRQYGVVARWQLLNLELSRHMIQARLASARLLPLHPGVYAVGHDVLSWRARLMAAALACGPDALLSHRAALAVWDVRPVPDGAIDVTVQARGARRRRPGLRIHGVRELPLGDRAGRDSLPVTSLPRSLLDFAATADPQQLRHAIEAADRRELLDHRQLQAQIERGRPGAKRLRAVVAQLRGPAPWTQSELERAFLTLVREHELPEPSANLMLHGHLVDFAWLRGPAALVAECDGYLFHKSRTRFEADRRQDTHLQTKGIPTIRVTQRRLQNEPDALARDLRALLSSALRASPPTPPRRAG